jgi:hypothetical protein
MQAYKTKTKRLTGTTYGELFPKAFEIYKEIKKQTKRKPYVRSAYFNKDKVFLDLFWSHFHSKNAKDKARRLKFYPCALDLIKNCKISPSTFENPMSKNDLLHRWYGLSKDGSLFIVQIKESKSNDQKYFISVFPAN